MQSYSVILNNINFTILGKIKGIREYVIVLSEREKNQKLLYFYRSQSEVGIWRLDCHGNISYNESNNEISIKNNGRIDKGEDYITSSCVVFELQAFINSIHNEIENIVTKGKQFYDYLSELSKRIEQKSQVVGEWYSGNCKAIHPNANTAFSAEIKIPTDDESDKYFTFLKKCEQSSCFSGGNSLSASTYRHFYNDLLHRTLQLEEHELYFLYLYELCTINDPVKKFIDCVSKFIQKYYVASTEYIEIGAPYEFVVDDNPVVIQICKMPLRRHDMKYSYDVVFIYYGVKHKRNNEYYWFKTIINLVYSDAIINEFGLYSKITSSGIYSTKPFDYFEQTTHMITPSVTQKETYKFVGNNYTNMYPVNLIDLTPKMPYGGINYIANFDYAPNLQYANIDWYNINSSVYKPEISDDIPIKLKIDKLLRMTSAIDSSIKVQNEEIYKENENIFKNIYDKYIIQNKENIINYDYKTLVLKFISLIENDTTTLLNSFDSELFKKTLRASYYIKNVIGITYQLFHIILVIFVYSEFDLNITPRLVSSDPEIHRKMAGRIEQLFAKLKQLLHRTLQNYTLEKKYLLMAKDHINNIINLCTINVEQTETLIENKNKIISVIYSIFGLQSGGIDYKHKILKYQNKFKTLLFYIS